MGRLIKNIIIRGLTEEDNKAIRAIMNDTGCYQASKALMRCAYSFLRMSNLAKQQANRIRELETENYTLKRNAMLIVEANKKLESILMISKK